MLTDEQKAEQWQRIQRDAPDLAALILEFRRVFGQLGGVNKPRDDGWLQPQIEGRRDEQKDKR